MGTSRQTDDRLADGFRELIVFNATLVPVTMGYSDVIDSCGMRLVSIEEIRTPRTGYPLASIWNMVVPPLVRPEAYQGSISLLISEKGPLILYTDLRTNGSPDCRGAPPPESRDLYAP